MEPDMDNEKIFPIPNRREVSGKPIERDELGRAHICIQCVKAVKPWGPCYQQGHEVAPIQKMSEFMNAN
jgi:hypothetical protein